MKVYIGADHRGFPLKENLKLFLSESGYEVEDLGASEIIPYDDYVDYAKAVAEKVTNQGLGIVICGSGAGVSIASNKIRGIRSSIGFNTDQVKASREDDNINILSLSSDFTSLDEAKKIVSTFLTTQFKPTENHTRRINKIEELEA